MVDPIPEDVESLLRTMSEMVTTLPTLADVVAAFAAAETFVPEDEVMGRMESAIALGYVDIFEDLGPETMAAISTLGAEKMGIRPTFDSRRWVDIATRKLLGPHDRAYREKKKGMARSWQKWNSVAPPSDVEGASIVALGGGGYRVMSRRETEDEDRRPLHARPDPKALRPDEIAEAVERFTSDRPPQIVRFYGVNAIWNGEEAVTPANCPYCKGEKIGVHGYCLKCHAAGMDKFLEKPKASRRKQMPEGKSKLKGGV